MKYRAEIDGLRALAVVPVILFHAGIEFFQGGFVGVDIFFVISGYLITSILIDDLQAGRFSIVQFYERRARRILPALFAVVIPCIPFAWMWMKPALFKAFSQSVMAVCLFGSNILFWQESDYFGTAAEAKPLLHTWSLAVEEQYYVFFPIFLAFIWRYGRSVALWLIVVFAIFSLLLTEWLAARDLMANFYLAPTRAWELFAGSITAFVLKQSDPKPNNVLSLLGLSAVLISIFFYDESVVFPSFYALLPVIGTVLIILYSHENNMVARILSSKAFVGIGLISYSAYLWHQPIFAFTRILSIDTPAISLMLGLSVLSLVLAYLSWYLIETPFRNRQRISRQMIFQLSGMFLLLVFIIGFVGDRYSESAHAGQYNTFNHQIDVLNYERDNKKLLLESWQPLRELSGNPDYQVEGNDYDRQSWFGPNEERTRVLLIGNSHSKDLFNVLSASKAYSKGYVFSRFGVQIKNIAEKHDLFDADNFRQAEIIMLVSKYDEADLNNLPRVLEQISQSGKKIFLVKSIFEFKEYRTGEWNLTDKLVYDLYQSEIPGEDYARVINTSYYDQYSANITEHDVAAVNRKLDKLGASFHIPVVDRMDYVCEQSKEICYAVDEKLVKYFYDYGHHTLTGAQFFAERINRIDWPGFRQ